MATIGKFKQTWRIASMPLLILALIGPWTYEIINVPAEYDCNAPYVRLEGDYCGEPMAGAFIIFWLIQGVIGMIAAIIAGTTEFSGRAREFLFMLLSSVPLLPLLSTPLVIWKKDSRGSNIFQLAAWGFATILGLFWVVFSINTSPHRLLWGAGIFAVLTSSVLVLELFALAVDRKVKQGE